MQHSVAAANLVGMDLAGEAEEGSVESVCGCEGCGGIEESGARHDRIDAGLAGGQRVAEGHVGSALLMAGVNVAYFVAGVVDGVIEMVVLHAWQAENRVDSMGEQAVDKGFAAGFRLLHQEHTSPR